MSGLPRDWVPSLVSFLAREPAVVRIIVAEVRGSAPREPGAFMLVGRDAVEGSIGGGQLEWEAIAAGRALLDDVGVAARVNKVVLGADVGQCCGGVVSVWLERFTAEDLGLLHAAGRAGAGGCAVLSSSIRGAGIERRVVTLGRTGLAAAAPGAGIAGVPEGADDAIDRLLREPRQCAHPLMTRNLTGELTLLERLDDEFPAVWLYGAGHVGQALARILTELPLRLTWIDSRAELFPAESPEGIRILRDADPVTTVSEAPVGAYFLVMSHSHPLDYALCHALLERHDFAWLGLIGSASKAARFRSRLRRAGLGAEVIANLTCPIGVAGITSKWPAAIAVGVAAQLMQFISAAAERPGLLRHEVVRELKAPLAESTAERCAPENCAGCGSSAAQTVARAQPDMKHAASVAAGAGGRPAVWAEAATATPKGSRSSRTHKVTP